jgi:hypothetical protein
VARGLLLNEGVKPSRSIAAAVIAATLVAGVIAAAADAEPAWKTEKTEPDGLVVESRRVPESGMPELRLVAVSSRSPAALMASAWTLRTEGMQQLYLAERRVLSDGVDRRVLFMRYKPPIITPREVVLRQQRWSEAATGAWHLRFRAQSFTPGGEHVAKFAHLRGDWAFEPDGKGGTRITYVALIDVGGIPAWLARGPQQDAAIKTVREVIDRAVEP